MLPVSSPCDPAVKAVGAHIVPGTRHVHIDSSCTLRIHYARKLTGNKRGGRGRWHDEDRADMFHTSQIGRRRTSHFGFKVDSKSLLGRCCCRSSFSEKSAEHEGAEVARSRIIKRFFLKRSSVSFKKKQQQTS